MIFQGFKRRLYYLYFITLLLPELRLQTKRTTAPIYKKLTTLIPPIIFCRLITARLGYIQPIAFEEFDHVIPAMGPMFPAVLRLLRPLLGLDFWSTNLPLNFLRAPSRSKHYLTPQLVLELFPQSTLPASFHLQLSRALFL